MKQLIFFACLLSAVAVAKTTELNSKEFCSVAYFRCTDNKTLMHAEDGRCACLGKRDYHPAAWCRAARYTCDHENGYAPARLYAGGELLGCGCFTTSPAPQSLIL